MPHKPDNTWQRPPDPLPLHPASVHVWRAGLAVNANQQQRFWQILSPDEQQRAERFYFPEHRHHFIAARGILRTLLAAYLGSTPAALRLAYSPHGKPALEPATAAQTPPLCFNISHSHGLALYAISWQHEVGIDLEHIRESVACLELATRFFSPHEAATLRRLPAHQQRPAFFAAWTRKEAYMKARGLGLSLGLDSFDVSLAPDEPPRLLATRDDPHQQTRWLLAHLEPAANYAAALVVARPPAAPPTDPTNPQIHCWHYDPDYRLACSLPV